MFEVVAGPVVDIRQSRNFRFEPWSHETGLLRSYGFEPNPVEAGPLICYRSVPYPSDTRSLRRQIQP